MTSAAPEVQTTERGVIAPADHAPARPPAPGIEPGASLSPRPADAPAPPAETGPGPAFRDPAEPLGPRAGEPAAPGPAAAAHRAPEPDPRPAIVEQLLASVRTTAGGTIEVRLSPEELGHVRLDIRMTDGGLTVVVDADRAETLDLMRRSADLLARELRDAGFGATNLAFGSGSSQRDDRPSAPPPDDESRDLRAPPAPDAVQTRRTATDRLDIRL